MLLAARSDQRLTIRVGDKDRGLSIELLFATSTHEYPLQSIGMQRLSHGPEPEVHVFLEPAHPLCSRSLS